jgi:hypothetical protein
MKNYAVYFTGYWPVGAVAYVKAKSANEAAEKLYNILTGELKENNPPKTMTVKEIKNEVEILLDGDY